MPYETYEMLENASALLKRISDALKDDGKISLAEIVSIVSATGVDVVNDMTDDEPTDGE